MKNSGRAALLLAGTIATLVACGGGGGGSNGGPSPAHASPVDGVATFSIPSRAPQGQGRHAQFVSSFVSSATIAINGAVVTTADLSATSPICKSSDETTRTCTIPLTAPAGNDTFTATLYDGANGTGHVLGIGVATLAVGGTSFTLPITVGGVAASLTINAETTTLHAGAPATIPLSITAKDAAGAVIAGADPFANPIPLTNSDTTGHTHLSTTALTSPQTPVTLTYDGAALTGNVVVGAAGGSTTVVPVSFTVATATPTPTATPTATPTPTPVPSIPSLAFTGGYSCSGTQQVALPGTYLLFVSVGALDTAGTYLSEDSEWALMPFTAAPVTPSPTGTPTATPSATPVPTGSPQVTLTLYVGTFTLATPSNGMQGGCFYVIAFLDGVLGGSPSPVPSGSASPTPAPNSFVIGAPNVGDTAVVGAVGQTGFATAINLHVDQAAGTGSGTFSLDNGVNGTITIAGKLTFDEARKVLKRSNALRAAMEKARRRQ